jgi:tmRNA-binding protein
MCSKHKIRFLTQKKTRKLLQMLGLVLYLKVRYLKVNGNLSKAKLPNSLMRQLTKRIFRKKHLAE